MACFFEHSPFLADSNASIVFKDGTVWATKDGAIEAEKAKAFLSFDKKTLISPLKYGLTSQTKLNVAYSDGLGGYTQLGSASYSSGVFTFNFVNPIDDITRLVVTQTEDGNAPIPVKVIQDSDKIAPSQPTAAFDAAGKVITGVAEVGSTVEVKNSGNTATLGTIVADVTTGAYSITIPTALINKETVNVTAKDAAGNVSAVKAIIAPDKTPPALPTAVFDTVGKVITGVAEAGSTVVVKNSTNTTCSA